MVANESPCAPASDEDEGPGGLPAASTPRRNSFRDTPHDHVYDHSLNYPGQTHGTAAIRTPREKEKMRLTAYYRSLVCEFQAHDAPGQAAGGPWRIVDIVGPQQKMHGMSYFGYHSLNQMGVSVFEPKLSIQPFLVQWDPIGFTWSS